MDLSMKNNKQLSNLTLQDLQKDRLASLLVEKEIDLEKLTQQTENSLRNKIKNGLDKKQGFRFLHTSPHPDDVMLGYLPYITELTKNQDSTHYFATATSGFNAVRDDYVLKEINNLERCLEKKVFNQDTDFFNDVNLYLEAVVENDDDKKNIARATRRLRNLAEIYKLDLTESNTLEAMQRNVSNLKKDLEEKNNFVIQALKGMIREWEDELMWEHIGLDANQVFHLRLGFYAGQFSSKHPEWNTDIQTAIDILEKTNPDIITVALDPRGSGPSTHFKVLQIVAQALKKYLKSNPQKKVEIWGYRNVWFRFCPTDANIFVPVSINSLSILKSAFHTCFDTQKEAMYPSVDHDGPFCDLAQKIMVEQYQILKTCLGKGFYSKNENFKLRTARGFCFLKSMTPEEFFKESEDF
jgi:glucosamine-6-phosphate deaminase